MYVTQSIRGENGASQSAVYIAIALDSTNTTVERSNEMGSHASIVARRHMMKQTAGLSKEMKK